MLPLDPTTGLPRTSSIGFVVLPGGSIPVVTPSSASISAASTTLVIKGSNFDPSAAGNVVKLSSGTVESISAASTTSLTIALGMMMNLRPGPLTASVTAFGLSTPAVQVATVASNLLVANAGDNISGCTLSGASITSCSFVYYFDPNAQTLFGPRGMAVANNVAYITNSNSASKGGNRITQCSISDGTITSCSIPTGVTWNLNKPYGIAVAGNVAYITNYNGNTVTECALSGGSIFSCGVPTGFAWNLINPTGITIVNNVAYVTNYAGNSITQCQITSGSITSCAVPSINGAWNLNGPTSIAVANNVAYITNVDGDTITQCPISGGSITSCAVPAGVTFKLDAPFGVAIQNNVAYITNLNQDTITECTIVAGSITACEIPAFFFTGLTPSGQDNPYFAIPLPLAFV